jgi:hypothetical protein
MDVERLRRAWAQAEAVWTQAREAQIQREARYLRLARAMPGANALALEIAWEIYRQRGLLTPEELGL